MSAVDLGTAPLSRLFLRYVTPTVAAMLVTGIYVTIDGIFVGHILGQDGLAGMMLAYPICAVLYAVGALIGMGSSSLASFYLGKGEQAKARHIVGNALVMVLLASAVLAFIGINYGDEMLAWMGAEGLIFDAGLAYLQWYAWLGVFAVLSMAFTALLRNDGRPGLATWILVGGGVLNVLLDYLLMAVVPWGLAGAAIATMLSQAVTGGLCLWHFFTPRSQLRIRWDTLVPDWRLMRETLRLGVSSFLMYLYLSVVLALVSDISMGVLGGALKRKESITGRLGDILSQLYILSCVLKRFEDDGRPQADLPLVHWAAQDALLRAHEALAEVLDNYPSKAAAAVLRGLTFPFGIPLRKPSDHLLAQVADVVQTPGETRDRLLANSYIPRPEIDKLAYGELGFRLLPQVEQVSVTVLIVVCLGVNFGLVLREVGRNCQDVGSGFGGEEGDCEVGLVL